MGWASFGRPGSQVLSHLGEEAPRVIGLIAFLGFVALIWTLVTVVIGIRQAGEMTTGGAIITAFLGWIPTVIAVAIIAAIL